MPMPRSRLLPFAVAALLVQDLALAPAFGIRGLLAGLAAAQDDDGGDDGGDDGDDGDGDDGDDDDDDDDDDNDDAGGGVTGNGGGPAAGRGTPGTAGVPADAAQPARAAGEIVVSGLTPPDLARLRAEGFTVAESFQIVENGPVLHRLRVPAGLTLEAARDRVRGLPSGRNADFNHYYRAGEGIVPAAVPAAAPAAATAAGTAAPCAHLNCIALAQIGWPAARGPGCSAAIEIGVIDTGVNLGHAGLGAAQVELVRLTGTDLPASGETHGTAVVSLLVGAEARAPGILPEARIVAVDIFSREGGDERADVAHLVDALDYLADRGIRVANLSLAGPENTVLSDMLAAVAAKGMLVVAAAGNQGPAAPPAWPAAAETALAVTAVDADGRIYRRAQRGVHLDLAAPGVEVWSAASVKGVKPRTGTSYAAPFATAAAAVLMARDPEMTPAEAAAALRGLTRDLGTAGADEVYGAGLLDLARLCDLPAPAATPDATPDAAPDATPDAPAAAPAPGPAP